MVLSDFLLFSSSCPLIFQSDHFGLSRDRSFRLANAPSKAAVSSTAGPTFGENETLPSLVPVVG